MKFDSQQMKAVTMAVAAAEAGGVVAVFGKAGTGKTTVGRTIVDRLLDLGYDVRCAAFTNKAVDRMREVGYPKERCMTLNRLLYTTTMGVDIDGYEFSQGQVDKILAEHWTQKNAKILDGIMGKAGVHAKTPEETRELRRDILGKIKRGHGDRKSVRVPKDEEALKKSGLSSSTVVVVDEMSMVPLDMADDCHGVFKTVIFLGDPGQIPPVNSVDTCPYLGVDKKVTLTTVHRVEDNADLLDKVYELDAGKLPEGTTPIPVHAFKSLCEQGHKFIVFTNKAVAWINDEKRKVLGCAGKVPQIGEPLISVSSFGASRTVSVDEDNERWFLANESKLTGIFDTTNGKSGAIYRREAGDLVSVTFVRVIQKSMTFQAAGDPEPQEFSKLWTLPFTMEGDENERIWTCTTLPFWRMSFNDRTTHRKIGSQMRIDFAHAITAHKSQGSEWDKVAVMVRKPGFRDTAEEKNMISRLNYTAASRAKKDLFLFTSIIGCPYG